VSVEVINFGCRLNIAEGEAIRAAAGDQDDLIVINSCAVTLEAERQARQAIRRAAKRRPEARIIVTGCAAEIGAFAGMAEVSGVVENRVKGEAERYLPFGLSQAPFELSQAPFGLSLSKPSLDEANDPFPSLAKASTSSARTEGWATPAVSGTTHARAFIEVQNGCDHRCTFCIIPYGRGESRSIPAGAVIDAVQAAVDRGQQEVILTGVDLTSYGPDLPGAPTLGMLVERILKHVPALPRLRLSSLDSVEIDPLLEEMITSEPRVMPHVHLSLQSGDDMILKRMKRRHSRAQAVALVERLKSKRPEIAIGADIIAGFPTETEAMFANSLALLDDCEITFGHIFPYSPRPSTPAARMPQLDRKVIKARAETLRCAAAARKADWLLTLVGTRQRALIELDGQSGHAENFAAVRLDKPLPPSNMRGTMLDIIITATDGKTLTGTPV
jgi:threonylcarbamoyladenosine tRNA methylthiotransferase MtaB